MIRYKLFILALLLVSGLSSVQARFSFFKKKQKGDGGNNSNNNRCFTTFVEHDVTEQAGHVSYEGGMSKVTLLKEIFKSGAQIPFVSQLQEEEGRRACGVLPMVNSSAQGGWYLTDRQHVVFEPAACTLRRLTPAGARNCLRGKYVALVGDSVMRYTYLVLAHLLVKQRHQARYHSGNEPNMAAGFEWGPWQQFMDESSKMLNDGVDAVSRESCDCVRKQHWGGDEMRRVREHRYLRLCLGSEAECRADAAADDHAANAANHAAGAAKGHASGGHGGAGAHSSKGAHDSGTGAHNNSNKGEGADRGAAREARTLRLRYQQAFGFPNWAQALADAVWAVLADGGDDRAPDLLVFNAAFWREGDQFEVDDLRQDLRWVFDNVTTLVQRRALPTKLVWRQVTWSTWHPELFAAIDAVALEVAREYGVGVLDARSPGQAAAAQGFKPEHVLFDSKYHSWAYLYQEYNDIFFNAVCTPECGWTDPELPLPAVAAAGDHNNGEERPPITGPSEATRVSSRHYPHDDDAAGAGGHVHDHADASDDLQGEDDGSGAVDAGDDTQSSDGGESAEAGVAAVAQDEDGSDGREDGVVEGAAYKNEGENEREVEDDGGNASEAGGDGTSALDSQH